MADGVDPEGGQPQIARAERLLGLVVVLMGSEQPRSRAFLRTQVPGYPESASDVAFERMFERDKDELRSMGVPVETVRDASDEVLGYRIRHADYALPELQLTEQERSAVAVAGQVWGQANLAEAADWAVRKLDATDWTPADLRGSVQLTASDAALPGLMAAVRERTVVRFPYRGRADAQPRERVVTPWGLRSAGGAWFCIGYDHDRQAQRTFRLSRITGTLDPAKKVDAVPAPADFSVSAVALAPATGEPITARVRLAPGRAAAVRRLAAAGQDAPWEAAELTVSAGSLEQLVSAVCGAGADAVVVEPETVVAAVRAALQAVLDAGPAA